MEPKRSQAEEQSLERFVDAQHPTYDIALKEIRNGKKTSHWIWYIFPQLKGLGHSFNSDYYGISNLDEARRYLHHPILGSRLREITEAFMQLQGRSAVDVFGHTDAMKVCSCMTLFNEVAEDDLFQRVIQRYYSQADPITLELLSKSDSGILLGAIAGDVIGSLFEWNSTKRTDFQLFNPFSRFTDDTVMTVANADWLLTNGNLTHIMQAYGKRYPHAGYGGMFGNWLTEENPKPYNSFGNGSAMRVSPVGWAFNTLDETLEAARKSAEVTHNHPEGIKGAQAVAACIYLARTGKSKDEIRQYIETFAGYDLRRTCNQIRPSYSFDVTCQGSVPESIIAFLESSDYESAIRLAVSLGGDADTMGTIAGSIAEAFYGKIPQSVQKEVVSRLPKEFVKIMQKFHEKFVRR